MRECARGKEKNAAAYTGDDHYVPVSNTMYCMWVCVLEQWADCAHWQVGGRFGGAGIKFVCNMMIRVSYGAAE
jgi:hypothetical protein